VDASPLTIVDPIYKFQGGCDWVEETDWTGICGCGYDVADEWHLSVVFTGAEAGMFGDYEKTTGDTPDGIYTLKTCTNSPGTCPPTVTVT